MRTQIKVFINFDSYRQVSRVELFSNGCRGQNKNNILLGMVQHWLHEITVGGGNQIKDLLLIFPVRGHSFLPCDRLFGRISQDTASKLNITTPEKYHEIFKMHADEVFVYGKDWVLYDFKAAAAATYKLLVGLQQLKRILVHSYESKGS